MADILQITLPDGTTYDLKDSTAVTNVSWDSTNQKIQKTINGTTSDVVTLPLIVGSGVNSAQGADGAATGENSFAFEHGIASGTQSFAFGTDSQASGTGSVAFHGIASQQGALAMGGRAGNNTIVTASGIGAMAFGASAIASATYSIAIGYKSTSSGQQSVAIGTIADAGATRAISLGYRTKASSQYQTVIGKCNVEDNQDTYAFIIGNGTADDARSNALTVDWNGNISANNIVTSTSVSNTGLISFLNSNSTAVYTLQLPLYNGGVS